MPATSTGARARTCRTTAPTGAVQAARRGPNTIGYKIGEIIDLIDGLPFRSQAEKHELSMLYLDAL